MVGRNDFAAWDEFDQMRACGVSCVSGIGADVLCGALKSKGTYVESCSDGLEVRRAVAAQV